jgi:hypothetical protein
MTRQRTGFTAAGMPPTMAVMASRTASPVCPASWTQPAATPTVRVISGSHHSRTRSTGQMATRTNAATAATRPVNTPAMSATMGGCHLLAAMLATSRAVITQVTQNVIFAVRIAERRTGASMTVTVPDPRPNMPRRLNLGMTQLPFGGDVSSGVFADPGPGQEE